MLVARDRDAIDEVFDCDGLSGWSDVLKGDVRREMLPGRHHDVLREPYVAATIAAVSAFLAASGADAARG